MTGLFRPLKRTTGMIVAGIGVVGWVGVMASLVAGDSLLALSAGMLALGYGIAVLVGLFTARNPQSVASLVVAAGGLLIALSALAGAWGTTFVAAILLGAAGGLLYRVGQPPEPETGADAGNADPAAGNEPAG